MGSPRPTNEGYFEGLIAQARAEGHEGLAAKLDDLLHHTAWTTSSELLGELSLAIRAFQTGRPRVSPPMRQLLRACLRATRPRR